MQLMPINRPSTIYINSDEALVNINVTVIGMSNRRKKKENENIRFLPFETIITKNYRSFQ